jgi:hypothetical protein
MLSGEGVGNKRRIMKRRQERLSEGRYTNWSGSCKVRRASEREKEG